MDPVKYSRICVNIIEAFEIISERVFIIFLLYLVTCKRCSGSLSVYGFLTSGNKSPHTEFISSEKNACLRL